ncbi:hypothetical protein [uncultured Arthrobacter sp.]|uniref:hypothetical protein n=1 Tax=uncultured Arthrobacter sp. TaxID=114050 RepID=UPI0025EFB8AB|nr:hypothetical protein [uncultured Arthrobacter sp.]
MSDRWPTLCQLKILGRRLTVTAASDLDPDAAAALGSCAPGVPAISAAGEPTLQIDPANGFGAIATVPTDIGIYTVQLLRRDQGSPWKVNRLHPPTDTTPAPPHP